MKDSSIIDKIREDIKLGFDVIDKNINLQEEAVLIIGHNGSGKTTLSRYLTGVKVEGKIDNSTIPSKYEYKDQNLAFWDLPSFCNNIDSFQDIASSLYVTKLLENYKKVKIIVLVSEKSFGGKLEEFIQMVNLVGKMFDGKISDESFVFIINNATVEDHKELANFLESVLSDKLTQYPDFLEALIKQASNNKIVFFKNIEDLETKDKIIQLIEKIKCIDEITNSVSSVTNYKITELLETINNDIQNIILENYSEPLKRKYMEPNKKDELVDEIGLVKNVKDINGLVEFFKKITITEIEVYNQLEKNIENLNFLDQFNHTEVEVIVSNYKNKLLSSLYQSLDVINQKILLLNENNLKIVEEDLFKEKNKEAQVDIIKKKDVVEDIGKITKEETQIQIYQPNISGLNPVVNVNNKNLLHHEELRNNCEHNNKVVEEFKKDYGSLSMTDFLNKQPIMSSSFYYSKIGTSKISQLIENTIKNFKAPDNKLPDLCINIVKFIETYKKWDDVQAFCVLINEEFFKNDPIPHEYFEFLKYKAIANKELEFNKYLNYNLDYNLTKIISIYDKVFSISLKNEINTEKAKVFIHFGNIYKDGSLEELKKIINDDPQVGCSGKEKVILHTNDKYNVKNAKIAISKYEEAQKLTTDSDVLYEAKKSISSIYKVLNQISIDTGKKVEDLDKESSCMIFSVTDVEYDNPILNHPEIIKILTNNLSMSFSEVIDKVSNFDKDFVREVCLSGNVELLQECFELS